MKVAIIIHSKTGITLKLAQVIQNSLVKDGHQVELANLKTTEPIVDSTAMSTVFKFTNLPDVSAYDAILFGGPIWAFRPSPVIRQAIQQCGTKLQGKKVFPFITMGFPFAWMTGNGSLSALRSLATKQGAKVLSGAILTGRKKNDAQAMQAIAAAVCTAIK